MRIFQSPCDSSMPLEWIVAYRVRYSVASLPLMLEIGDVGTVPSFPTISPAQTRLATIRKIYTGESR